MLDWFQPMTFVQVVKRVVGFQAFETATAILFRGVIQPLQARRLMLKPEGQRAWTWLWLHSDPSLRLEVDDVVIYNGVQTRVMALKDYTLYGYVEYELCQDWTGAGPCGLEPATPIPPEDCDPDPGDPCDGDPPCPPDPCASPCPPAIPKVGLTTVVALNTTSWTALPATPLAGRKAISVQNRSGIEIALNFSPLTPGYAGVLVPDGYERSYNISVAVILYAKASSGTPSVNVEELS
jgi:hypothetical protein